MLFCCVVNASKRASVSLLKGLLVQLMSSTISFKIASRQSPLAVRQTGLVRAQLGQALGITVTEYSDRLSIKTFVTQGGKRLAGSLATIGGKGLFTKEIEHALLSGEADIAVHSMKDMPAIMPEGLVIAAIAAREHPRDAFISAMASSPWELPENAVFGTSSVRREAQLLHKRPDLRIVPLRGNVGRRLEKLEAGQADATLLAEAGLRRLDNVELERTVLETKEMLPAVGQGVLCIQMREDDERLAVVSEALSCERTTIVSAAERAFLTSLDGSCQTPIAGLARIEGEKLIFEAQLLSLDGREEISATEELDFSQSDKAGRVKEATEFGTQLAASLYEASPESIQQLVRRG